MKERFIRDGRYYVEIKNDIVLSLDLEEVVYGGTPVADSFGFIFSFKTATLRVLVKEGRISGVEIYLDDTVPILGRSPCKAIRILRYTAKPDELSLELLRLIKKKILQVMDRFLFKEYEFEILRDYI